MKLLTKTLNGMNILRHSATHIMKHKRHHHIIVALLVVLVAGVSGVSLYKKFAQAATFDFMQSSGAVPCLLC